MRSARARGQGLSRLPLPLAQEVLELEGLAAKAAQSAAAVPAANVQYGRGVAAVSDPPEDNTYIVTFNRSLTNSVVQALAGIGDPPGSASVNLLAIPEVKPAARAGNQAAVDFQRAATGTPDRYVIPNHCVC